MVGGNVECEECGESLAKYKCPRCGFRSCSLPCVKAHKDRTGCNGKRDPTVFVTLSEFDDNRLVSDYNFLEETLRAADIAKRTRYKKAHGARSNVLKVLSEQCKHRKTRFRFMAGGMTKRKANTTRYDRKRKCMYWKVEWIFDTTDVRLVDEEVDEHVSLGSVLEKHLTQQSHISSVRHQLREFIQKPLSELKLLYKKELSEMNSYCELNVKEPLREQLAYKTVVEFPVITVVLPSEMHRFSVVEDPRPVKAAKVTTDDSPVEDVLDGKVFQEEVIEDEEDMDVFSTLEDLPGNEALFWKDMNFQTMSCDIEEGEISS